MTLRPLLLLALCVPLAACAGDHRGLETTNQPVVTRTPYTMDLLAGADGLAGGEPQRLRGWLATLAAGYGDRLSIDDPDASPTVRADVAAIAGEHGLSLSAAPASDAAGLSPGMVRVTVLRSTASVPSCAAPRPNGDLVNFDAHISGDFGCAVNGNLAAMVADPADLLRGKVDDGRGAGWTAGKAVGVWRRAAPTGAGGTAVKSESTGGK